MAAAFVAQDMGLYQQEHLDVKTRILVGVAAPNAILSGSADLTIGTGTTLLKAELVFVLAVAMVVTPDAVVRVVGRTLTRGSAAAPLTREAAPEALGGPIRANAVLE